MLHFSQHSALWKDIRHQRGVGQISPVYMNRDIHNYTELIKNSQRTQLIIDLQYLRILYPNTCTIESNLTFFLVCLLYPEMTLSS